MVSFSWLVSCKNPSVDDCKWFILTKKMTDDMALYGIMPLVLHATSLHDLHMVYRQKHPKDKKHVNR